MAGYSGPRLRPSPESTARALSDAWAAPGEDPGVGIDRALNAARAPYRLRPVNGLPHDTDDGEVLDGHPELDRLPTAEAVAQESERPGGMLPPAPIRPADAPDGPGDRPQPVELARDLLGVQIEVNLIAAHLPELAATVGRLVPGAAVPGGLVRKLGTLRARTATAAAGIGAVVRDLTGPGPARPAVAGVGTGDALGDLIASLMKELADLLADRRCEAPWDEARRERLRATAAMVSIVAGAKVGGA